MTVKQIKAYLSEDGCIWATKEEAIVQNIDNILADAELGPMTNFKNFIDFLIKKPNEVKYIQDNAKYYS